MKWSPQPKDRCGRPDCGEDARQWGYCEPHSKLFRRWGTPYRRDEQDEHRSGNRYQQEWDEALRENPPVIRWRKKNNGVMVAVEVRDPHAETGAQRTWDEQLAREEVTLQAMEDTSREVTQRLEQHRAHNTPLMTAARTPS